MRSEGSMLKRNVFITAAKGNKLLLVAIIVFLVIALPSVYVFEKKVRAEIYNDARSELNRELETKAASLKNHLNDSITAIRFLNATPPIQGISRATDNQLIDPLLQTPIAVWQDRLADIFSGFMQTDDSILQARYIMLAENGQEIVRVDRFLGDIIRLEGAQLQKKGGRDYVLKASMLDEKSVYISPINYNRENGEIQKPFVSTYRVAKPVFDHLKQVFAILVTNYSADKLFESLTFELPPGINIYLLNNESEFLYHPNPDLRFGFEFNQAKTWSDEFSPTQNMNSHETLLIGDAPKQYFLNKRVSFEGDIAMLPLEMAVSIDSETLLERIAKRRESFIAITATFFTIFIIITLLYQRYINRKLLIHSLTEQNNKVIENSLDAIFTIDSDETIIHCNQTAKKVFASRLGNDNTRFSNLFTLADEDKNCISETIEHGSKMPFEAVYTGDDGNKEYYSITLTSVFDVFSNRYQVAAILRNISSLKQTQSQLQGLNSTLELKVSQRTVELERAIDQALAASQAKSDFVANISHEIRTPMNGVLGMLEMLKEDSLNEQQQHYLKLANSSAHSLMSLINDILDFSKIEAGKLDIDNHSFDVISVCSDMINSIALQGQRKGLEVFLNTQNVVDRMVIGDSHRLKQILINLINNAFKFTHKGEVTLTLNSRYITDSKILMSFIIKDTGIGIAPENIDKLFDVFTQEDSSTTRHFGGTGLGLSICKKLAQLMGGNITVSSEKGVGSTFIATVELHVAQQQKLNTGIELSKEVSVAALIARDNVFKNVCGLLTQTCKIQPSHITRLDYFSEHSKFDADLLIIDDEHPQVNALISYCEKADKKYVLILRDMVVNKQSKKVFPEHSHILHKPLTQDQFTYKLGSIFGANNEFVLTAPKQANDIEPEPELSKYHVLLVDDNMINIEVAKAILKRTGIKITCASDGIEALSALKFNQEQPFDLILMDCQMPNLDGYDTTSEIRNAKAGVEYISIPIIAMTASAMEGDRERCITAGMNDYITKPIKPKTLKNRLLTWLN